jgi:hypothetical protein
MLLFNMLLFNGLWHACRMLNSMPQFGTHAGGQSGSTQPDIYYNQHHTLARPKVPATKVHSLTAVHGYPELFSQPG